MKAPAGSRSLVQCSGPASLPTRHDSDCRRHLLEEPVQDLHDLPSEIHITASFKLGRLDEQDNLRYSLPRLVKVMTAT